MTWVSVFVFFALFLLRPFNVHIVGNPALTSLGYALVTFIVSMFYGYTTSRLLKWEKSGDNWTLWKWIMDSTLLLACISVGNFIFYNFTVGWIALAPAILATITVPTVLVGLFPIAFSGMAVQLRAERDNRKAAGQVSLAVKPTSAPAAAPVLVALNDTFSVDSGALLFCESRQNYVRCVYLCDGHAKEEIIRATLSGLEDRLAANGVLRCHRSYLVNPDYIREARGNAQGLKLSLVAAEEEVPVSRAYVSLLREKLD